MKISSIEIKSFRSIKHAKINLNNVTAIVGENNAGKTAFLRAINAVLNFENERESFINKINQYTLRSNTHISINFKDVPNKKFYQNYNIFNEFTLIFSYFYAKNKYSFSIKGKKNIQIDEGFMDVIKEDFTYVYIPSNRSNDDVKWGENSVLKDLIISHSANHTENKDTITGTVKTATNKIHDSILVKLESRLNKLYLQNKNVDFKIQFPSNIDYTYLLDKIEISLNENNGNYPLQEWGSGTKSLAIIAMHRANALLKDSSILLGIEEPEMNLHPQAQKRFIYSLKNNLESKETQAIFTTHSTVLINELNHTDIVLVRREPDKNRGFISAATQLPIDFWAKYNLEEFKHYQYFFYKNSDFFFSKFVVICESKNDSQVFESLVKDDLADKIADISFLNADGKHNIRYPYFLLKELKIPFLILVDMDYFFPYKNGNISDSRDSKTGLPQYSNQLENDIIINDLFPTASLKQKLMDAHNFGYRKFFDFLKPYHISSLMYSLDVDLTLTTKTRDFYYDELRLKEPERTQYHLVKNCNKSIKDINKMLKLINVVPKRNLPESYLKIKNLIIDEIHNISY